MEQDEPGRQRNKRVEWREGSLRPGTVRLTCGEQKRARRRMCDHAAATASRHWFATSARKIRRVERETRWRWRLKVLWTAACMLRNRWAERADLTAAFCVLVVVPADANFRLDIPSQPALMRAGQSQTPGIRGIKRLCPGFPHSLHRGRRPCVPVLLVTK